jgi:hypothetical protein
MSLPKTEEEKLRAQATQDRAGLAENLVSTACPGCGITVDDRPPGWGDHHYVELRQEDLATATKRQELS